MADLIERLVAGEAPTGCYHASSAGRATWFEFARAVCAAAGLGEDAVTPTTTEAFPRPAPRPAFSVLDHATVRDAGVAPIGDWRERWDAASREVLAAG